MISIVDYIRSACLKEQDNITKMIASTVVTFPPLSLRVSKDTY